MNANVIQFSGQRDKSGVLIIPPPEEKGAVYVFFGKPRPRSRKSRWFILIQFCDRTHEFEEGAADWQTAILLARVRARKYGFRVIDMSDIDFG
jgi:hypothetical protein